MAEAELTKMEDQVSGKSNSVISDPKEVRKRMLFLTYATFSGAASYIIMLFVAMPLAIHLIVNVKDGCDVTKEDSACFAPTSKSETQLTVVLSLLRVMTFLFGSLVGSLSDILGRKPLLVFALTGYTVTGLCFVIGWKTQFIGLFILGGMLLGASSPITPHGIAYVSDISTTKALPVNLGILQGFGYFFGLMGGAILSLAFGRLSEKDGETDYDLLFYTSFLCGTVLSITAGIITLIFIPESLDKKDRAKKLDILKANPFAFVTIVSRNGYLFFVWFSAFVAWISVGAAEVVTGGWWLRRYVLTEVNDFITYIVLLWVSSGFGAVICTSLFVKATGIKGGIHIGAIFTIVVGIAFSFAPDATLSYIAVGLSFFAAPLLPITFALLMRQVGPKEKGALAGALRSSEALGKFIGIIVFGTLFASYIEEFTPDASCVPATYTGAGDKTNNCECGVNTCPTFIPGEGFKFQPEVCTLGQLSAKIAGKPSKFIPNNPDPNDPFRILPQLSVSSASPRPATCKGAGQRATTKGFDTTKNRFFCASVAAQGGPPPGPGVGANFLLGCPGFDAQLASQDAGNFQNNAICNANISSPSCDAGAYAAFNVSSGYNHDQELFPGSGLPGIGVATALTILGKITDPSIEDFDHCNDLEEIYPAPLLAGYASAIPGLDELAEEAELNVCLEGPIASFPGLFPFIYMVGTGIVGYLSFIIAELFFKQHDVDYTDDEVTEEEIKSAEMISDLN